MTVSRTRKQVLFSLLCCVLIGSSAITWTSEEAEASSSAATPNVAADTTQESPSDDNGTQDTTQEDQHDTVSDNEQSDEPLDEEPEPTPFDERTINNIFLIGNRTVSDEALLLRIPYHLGERFKPEKSGKLIDNLYELGYFNKISLHADAIDDTKVDLYVVLEEKKLLSDIVYKGNKHLKEDDIEKKLELKELRTIDEMELHNYARAIEKMYIEKSFHHAHVTPHLEITDHHATAVFDITENKKSFIKRVFFTGNKSISRKELANIIFSREDWVFGFLSGAGNYHPDALEMDKMVIENYYQSRGFLMATVDSADVLERDDGNFEVTFNIQEGDVYHIGEVHAPGNDIVSEEELLSIIPIKTGHRYSKERIRKVMEDLRTMWGQHGYIYADIQPSIQPDEENKTVAITFYTELGKEVRLNRINIIGNKKTRDKVIRRQLIINEGEVLKSKAMDTSKTRVESLGYFEQQDGVNWKINRVSDELADLDLIVKEVRTGRANGTIGFGPSDRGHIKDGEKKAQKDNEKTLERRVSPADNVKFTGSVSELNLMGTGIMLNVIGDVSRLDKGITANILDPWLFDRPITGALAGYHRTSEYEDVNNVVNKPVEQLTGGSLSVGFVSERLHDSVVNFQLGMERIQFKNNVVANSFNRTVDEASLYQAILDRRFQDSPLIWSQLGISRSRLNHPINPSSGYEWNILSKVGKSFMDDNYFFYKFETNFAWYTPLIDQYNLVLGMHGFFGAINAISGKDIPYRELYHIGGQTTVRGFKYGEIGPFAFGTSLGGTKAFFLNTEIKFPVTQDYNIVGVIFYDGGAGWDTPRTVCINGNRQDIPQPPLRNNNFEYRHAIGFGFRMRQPQPIRIDWGFKLDRKRRRGESVSEVHFSMDF